MRLNFKAKMVVWYHTGLYSSNIRVQWSPKVLINIVEKYLAYEKSCWFVMVSVYLKLKNHGFLEIVFTNLLNTELICDRSILYFVVY